MAARPDSDVETRKAEREDDTLFCSECGEGLTRERWRMQVFGSHEHTFFNPAGLIFNLLCFEDAPGGLEVGEATSNYTWFAGHRWRIAVCGACDVHIGWSFTATGSNSCFFALIAERLVKNSK